MGIKILNWRRYLFLHEHSVSRICNIASVVHGGGVLNCMFAVTIYIRENGGNNTAFKRVVSWLS